MREALVLTGAGGCMRELLWQLEELNQRNDNRQKTWDVVGYVDISDTVGDVRVGNRVYPYLGTDDFLLEKTDPTNVAVCVGNPALRKKIVEKLKENPNLRFPNLILSDTRICPDVRLGQGVIISMDCRISTNVQIGDFSFLNMGSVVCHDGTLGEFVTLSPDVRLAGAVTVGDGSELGMGARVIQGIRIGAQTVVGAGGVVVHDLPDACTAVGVPARVISKNKM